MPENTPQSYSEKLKDPRWQKKRLEILERDGWACKYCFDSEKTLHVHHLFYFKNRDPWDIPSGFLLTLCETCHGPKDNNEECSCAEAIIGDISLVLNEFWKSGFEASNDLLELATAIGRSKRIGGPLEAISLSQKKWEPKKNG